MATLRLFAPLPGLEYTEFQKISIDFSEISRIIEVCLIDTVNFRRTPERGIKKGSTNFRRTPERDIKKGSKMTPPPPVGGGFHVKGEKNERKRY